MKVQGDVIPTDRPLPQTVDQVLDLIKHIPSYVAQSNGGKGKPLEVELSPLKLLAPHYGFDIAIDKLRATSTPPPSATWRVKSTMRCSRSKSLTTSWRTWKDFSEHATQAVINQCVDFQTHVNTADAVFRGTLKDAILSIRQTGASTSVLDTVIAQYNSNQYGARRISAFIDG